MKTAHKIRMNPTAEQVGYLKGACGSRRFIYNWGREHWEAEYQAYKLEQETVPEAERTREPPKAMGLKKQFNALRETAYPWSYHVTKCVVEGAFDDLEKASANFFAGRGEFPKYKKKGKSHESFYLSNDKFAVGSHWIAIPGLGRFLLDSRKTRDAIQKTDASQASHLSVSGLWAGDRSGSVCFLEPATDCTLHAWPPFGLHAAVLGRTSDP